MGDRIKRIVAFVIDWNLCLMPFIAIIFLLTPLIQSEPIMLVIYVLLFFLMIFASLTIFVLRDIIFKGRSIGKRIFKLHIIDNATRQEASAGKKALKNLFFFIYPIDGIVLLASGSSIGNYVTNTEVISEKTIAMRNNTYYQPDSVAKIVLSIVAVIGTLIVCAVIGFLCLFGSIQGMIEDQKDTEEYLVAYNYLIQSEKFDTLEEFGYDESDIDMTGFSSMTHRTPTSEGATETVTFKFKVDNTSLPVVCHKINGEWYACDDCTTFD